MDVVRARGGRVELEELTKVNWVRLRPADLSKDITTHDATQRRTCESEPPPLFDLTMRARTRARGRGAQRRNRAEHVTIRWRRNRAEYAKIRQNEARRVTWTPDDGPAPPRADTPPHSGTRDSARRERCRAP